MAKPNYGFEKRQRELVKKQKKEEKLKRKAESAVPGAPDGADATTDVVPGSVAPGSEPAA